MREVLAVNLSNLVSLGIVDININHQLTSLFSIFFTGKRQALL